MSTSSSNTDLEEKLKTAVTVSAYTLTYQGIRNELTF